MTLAGDNIVVEQGIYEDNIIKRKDVQEIQSSWGDWDQKDRSSYNIRNSKFEILKSWIVE